MGAWEVVALGRGCRGGLLVERQRPLEAPGRSDGSGGSAFGNGASAAGSSAAGVPRLSPPPENEEAQSYRAPVVSGRWVWTANPDTGKVAIVDAMSFLRASRRCRDRPDFSDRPAHRREHQQSASDQRRQQGRNLAARKRKRRSDRRGTDPAAGQRQHLDGQQDWQIRARLDRFARADGRSDREFPGSERGRSAQRDARGDALGRGLVPSRVFIDDAEKQAYVVAKSGISVIDLASKAGPRVLREEAVSD